VNQRELHHGERAIKGVDAAIDRAVISERSLLPAYLQLAILLRGMIIVRQLPAGTVLPSEAELTRRFKVNRDTVRRAMAKLQETGLAESRRGVGWLVVRTPEIQTVRLASGASVIVRQPQPPEQPSELLGLMVYVVTEPGKQPKIYDTAQTVLISE
jgi:DNA-binding transcriptional regulator YhcF (GntR family)